MDLCTTEHILYYLNSLSTTKIHYPYLFKVIIAAGDKKSL